MNTLAFIITRSMKNNVLEILRKPAKLVIWILVIVAIAGIFFLSVFIRSTPEHGILDLFWLKGIVFALFALFVILAVQKGLSRGDMIFSMSDVNLLFVSPVDSRHILLYGIVQMAKMSMMAGFFILFQGNSICANFDVSYSAVLLVFLGFILVVSLMQIVSLIIYSLTNGKPGRKRLVRIITVLVFTPLVAVFCIDFIKTGNALAALEATLRSPALSWMPVAGWAAEGTISLISGTLGMGFLFYGLIILSAAALIVYILRSNPDYYEDVLVATETAFEKERAAAEGKGLEAISERKVKVAKTGVGGYGASVLFSKHLRESFRSGRFGLWGYPTFLIVAGTVILSFIARDAGILMILGNLMFVQIFLANSGRGGKELSTHYIYMMPERAFSKMLWSNAETMLKTIVESAVMFSAAGLIMGESAAVIFLCAAVYALFALLLVSINYLSMRIAGVDISAGLTIIIYLLAVILALLPGAAAALIVGFTVGGRWGIFLGLTILAVWELIAACLFFAAAKGILHNCDMLIIKTK